MIKSTKTTRIIIVGCNEVGKTSYVRELMLMMPEKNHISMPDIQITKMEVPTNCGSISVSICNYNKKQQQKLDESYYLIADGVLILYDLSLPDTFNKAMKEVEYIKELGLSIPTVLCGNKLDKCKGKIKDPSTDLPHYKISVIDNRNILEPLQKLLGMLYNDNIIIIRRPIPRRQVLSEFLIKLYQDK